MVQCKLINHSEYSLEERERLATSIVTNNDIPHVCLSTCNRIELYWGAGETPEHIVRHLYRVASGLESALTGEHAIQGQLKQAYSEALAKYRLSPQLNRLFQSAIHTGKRVRTETKISEGAVSHSQVTVELLKQSNIDLNDKVVAIIGVNKLTEDILKYLVARRAVNIFLSSRNLEKAKALAKQYNGTAMSLNNKRAMLAFTDVLICATSAPHVIIKKEDIPQDKAMMIFDLAFPRDVEESAGQMKNVTLFNLEQIERFAKENVSLRTKEIHKAEQIIEEEIAKFYKMLDRTNSQKASREAVKYIAGGVNSPVRALRSVSETPLFIQRARGTTLTDVDGNRLTDFCLSWGVFLLGHNHPSVNKAVRQAVANGTSYGIPSLQETELAKQVNQLMPNMEKMRFVNSGTEAVMSAIRLARGFTGRNLIVKFDGCYHGHADHLLVSAGSGAATLSKSSSVGVPDGFTAYTLSLPFNDKDAINKVFKEKGKDIAAVIVEPVPANMGVVLPDDDFLPHLRKITQQYASLLIFDEVITGFRLSAGGAQQLFGITPDLMTVGKIMGGGFPAAAFGGRADIMAHLAPDGDVYQAGTLSGNPVAMSAGAETLRILSTDGFYQHMEAKTETFIAALKEAIRGKDIIINHVGSMFTLFFNVPAVRSFEDVKKADRQRFAGFFRYMLGHGFYISPSQFEANFLSVAHKEKELERFIKAVRTFRG